MKKQSAVQWLVEQVNSDCLNSAFIRPELVEQANKMFEEQHQETFKQSRQAKIFEKDMPPVWESWEQYYNETYGGNK